MEPKSAIELFTPRNASCTIVPLGIDTKSGIEGLFQQLRTNIRLTCYPSTYRIPFVAKEIFLSSDKQFFILISTHGKACYFKLNDPNIAAIPIIDLSGIFQEEVRNMAIIGDQTVFFGDIYGKFCRVNLKTLKVKHYGTSGNLRALIIVNQKLYVFDDNIVIIDQQQIFQVEKFWKDFTLCLAVSKDEKIYAVATKSLNVYIYHSVQKVLITSLETDSEASALKLSNKYLVLANGGIIKIWSTTDWQLIDNKYGNTQRYTSLCINSSESLIAAGCKDGSVHIWSLVDKNLLPLKFSGYSESIEKVDFIDDSSIFYFSSEQSRLLILQIPNFPQEYCANIATQMPKRFEILTDSNRLLVSLQNNGLLVLKSDTLQQVNHLYQQRDLMYSLKEAQNLMTININNSSDKHIDSYILRLHNLRQNGYESYLEPDERWWVTAQAIRPNYPHYILCFANGILSIMGIRLEIIRDCKIHENIITAVICLNSGKHSISGDISGILLMYNLEQFSQSGKFKQHNSEITALAVSQDDQLLLSGSVDGIIRISEINSKTCISTIRYYKNPISNLYITQNETHFLASSKNGIFTIWNMNSKTLIAVRNKVVSFGVSADESKLYLAGQGKLYSIYNPLKSQTLSVFGNEEDSGPFFKYIYKILKNQIPPYNAKYNNWLIAPYLINSLHLYAFANLSRHLKLSLQKNALFVEDLNKNTALTICVKNQSLLMNDVIEFLVDKLERYPRFSYFFSNILINITRLGSSKLSDLYNHLFQRISYPQLPEFCNSSIQLPIFVESQRTHDIKLNEFFIPQKVDIGKAIQFKQFSLKMNFEMGSQDSIDFLQSLLECPNPEIFRNDFVSKFLEYKWLSTRWVMSIYGLIYALYLILLIIYISVQLNSIILIFLVFISSLMFIYEIMQMIGMKFSYLLDVINLVDVVRAISFYVHVVLFFSEVNEYAMKSSLVVLVIVSLIRGITYFSLFSITRYMTYLIKEVLKDMLSFLILLGYSIIAVTAVFTAIDSDQERGGFDFYLDMSYKQSLGDFDTDDYSTGEKILFLFSSIINMIIMLNLLISILGDTFDRVQSGLTEADRFSIAQMVLEIESLLFWKRETGKQTYFSVCSGSKIERDSAHYWEGKIRVLMNKIEETKNLVSKNQQTMATSIENIIKNELDKKLQEQMLEINRGLDKINSKVDAMKQFQILTI